MFGTRCAVGGFGVGKAFGTVQARLGNLACANAFEGACGARQVEFAGKGFGKEFGLVVTACTQFGRLHGHGNEKVDRNARICNAEFVGGDEVANQIVGEPDAFAIFKGLDEVAKGVVVPCHNEGAFKGGGLLKAFRTGKVVAFGECRFGSAADARGVAMEREAFETLLADVSIIACGLVAEGAIAWIEQVEKATAPGAEVLPKG